jgi:hypothetical protein
LTGQSKNRLNREIFSHRHTAHSHCASSPPHRLCDAYDDNKLAFLLRLSGSAI